MQDIDRDENDAVIVDATIAMAKHMQIDSVAEGVETRQALEFLQSRGCCKFHDYIFGRPMPFNEQLDRFSGKHNRA